MKFDNWAEHLQSEAYLYPEEVFLRNRLDYNHLTVEEAQQRLRDLRNWRSELLEMVKEIDDIEGQLNGLLHKRPKRLF